MDKNITETNQSVDYQSVAITIGAIAAAIGTIVYSFKNIKNSDCLGAHCEQKVDGADDESLDIEDIVEVCKNINLVSNV